MSIWSIKKIVENDQYFSNIEETYSTEKKQLKSKYKKSSIKGKAGKYTHRYSSQIISPPMNVKSLKKDASVNLEPTTLGPVDLANDQAPDPINEHAEKLLELPHLDVKEVIFPAAKKKVKMTLVEDDKFMYPLLIVKEVIPLATTFEDSNSSQNVGNNSWKTVIVGDHYTVKFKKNISPAGVEKFIGKYDLSIRKKLRVPNTYLIAFNHQPSIDEFNKIRKIITKSSIVLYVEDDNVGYVGNTYPNDPLFNTEQRVEELWYLDNIKAYSAWDYNTDCSDITVAVVDSGIDPNHPDLENVIDAGQSYNFVTRDPNYWMDENHHGTHIAGTIGAIGNNSIGVAGICWNVKIIAIRVLDARTYVVGSSVSDGLAYTATDTDAKIINASIQLYPTSGFRPVKTCPQAIQDAISLMEQKKQIFVAAAGNYSYISHNKPSFPAACESDYLVSVVATGDNNFLYYFPPADQYHSNYGPHYKIGAPGIKILATVLNNEYEFLSGTSMASPIVAGSLALAWSFNPSLTALELIQHLYDSAEIIPRLMNTDNNVEAVKGGRKLNLLKLLESVNPNSSSPTWNEWSNWSNCTAECDGGERERTRTCNGTGCVGDSSETQACNEHSCPTWSEWSNWSNCTAECDGGTQKRSRTCDGTGCEGNSSETRACNEQQCSSKNYDQNDQSRTPGTWNQWSDWYTCSAECGGGTQERTRTCDGTGCEGNSSETRACNEQQCSSKNYDQIRTQLTAFNHLTLKPPIASLWVLGIKFETTEPLTISKILYNGQLHASDSNIALYAEGNNQALKIVSGSAEDKNGWQETTFNFALDPGTYRLAGLFEAFDYNYIEEVELNNAIGAIQGVFEKTSTDLKYPDEISERLIYGLFNIVFHKDIEVSPANLAEEPAPNSDSKLDSNSNSIFNEDIFNSFATNNSINDTSRICGYEFEILNEIYIEQLVYIGKLLPKERAIALYKNGHQEVFILSADNLQANTPITINQSLKAGTYQLIGLFSSSYSTDNYNWTKSNEIVSLAPIMRQFNADYDNNLEPPFEIDTGPLCGIFNFSYLINKDIGNQQ